MMRMLKHLPTCKRIEQKSKLRIEDRPTDKQGRTGAFQRTR